MHHPPDHSLFTRVDLLHQVLIAPKITEQETIDGCSIALDLDISNIWVKPCYLHQTINTFHTKSLNIGTFIGYPFGISTTYVKLTETRRALSEGVNLLALSLNLGDIVAGNTGAILKEVRSVCGLAHMNAAECMALVDYSQLGGSQALRSIEAAVRGGADGVVIKIEREKDTESRQVMEILDYLGRNKISSILYFPGKLSADALDTVFRVGFNRVGMGISKE